VSKINETTRNAPAIRDLADAELDGVNGGSYVLALVGALNWAVGYARDLERGECPIMPSGLIDPNRC
jgi:hypothetical protein